MRTEFPRNGMHTHNSEKTNFKKPSPDRVKEATNYGNNLNIITFKGALSRKYILKVMNQNIVLNVLLRVNNKETRRTSIDMIQVPY